jgi:S1-C subfamily serine protease
MSRSPLGYPVPPEPPPPRSSPLSGWLVPILCLLIGFAFYRFYVDRGSISTDPRPVTARGDLAADEKATIALFKENSPSVVYITTLRATTDVRTLNTMEIPAGTGSGFIWDNAGHIVTNFHVVQGASGAQVTLWNHKTYSADLVGVAPNYDMALLRINAPASELRPIPLGKSSNLQVGQKAFAIGNPFGLDQSLTTGIVSALGRQITAVTGRPIEDVIQTDASVNPGNSGGPLLDSAGLLIGVNTAIYSPSGTSAGIGFAVPVDTVNRVIPQLLAKGKIIRPYLGIRSNDAFSARMTRQMGVPGLLVLIVEPNSPAQRAGLRPTRQAEGSIVPGDIVQQVDEKKITSADDLFAVLERHKAGDDITIKIYRDGENRDVKVKLEPPKE